LHARDNPGGAEVISALAGEVAVVRADGLVQLRCGPVTLELLLPLTQSRELHAGEYAELQTYLHFSSASDSLRLFGFTSAVARDLFTVLIGASGVGPKVALALLELGVGGLVGAVQQEDEKMLTSVPGVGLKLAKKVILELKDKLAREFAWAAEEVAGRPATAESQAVQDALDAVVALGYTRQRAGQALALVRADAAAAIERGDTAELIRRILSRLAR
jgi:Holliday junction DNA helicase RuvA